MTDLPNSPHREWTGRALERIRAWGRAVVLGAFHCALILLLSASPLWAQSNGKGSIYSRFGVGTLIEFSSSQTKAMGGGGYALRSLNYNPDANPALWSDQVYTRLSGSVSYETISAKDSRGNTGQLTSGNVEAVKFNFPISERTLGVGLSFQPFSRTNYNVIQSGTVEVGPTRREATYNTEFTGSGGLHRLRGGVGYRVNEILSLGASADLLFGILESQRRTSFDENAPNLRNVVVSDGTRLTGLTGTFGGHLALVDVLRPDDALSIGMAITLPASLSGEQVRTLDEDLARDTLTSRDGEVTLPWQSRLGVAYQPNERWTVVIDGLYEPWSNFSSTFPASAGETTPGRFPVGGEQILVDRWRFSAGAEVVPAGEDQLAGYFSQVAYRMGAYVERMYVRPVPETDLHIFAATAGMSLPTSLSGTRIDLNAEAGIRGKTSNSLVRDAFVGVSLHLNFGERWFKRRKLR